MNILKNSSKPLIGITRPAGEINPIPRLALTGAVILGGGFPCILTPQSHERLKECSGIIISGGSDIYPGFYGEKPSDLTTEGYDKERDEFEFKVIDYMFANKINGLGICRGMQLLNIYRGGDLYQEVDKFFTDFVPTKNLWHKIMSRRLIFLNQQSRLAKSFSSSQLSVNSLHHQAVKKTGKGLNVAAKESSGLVQALEYRNENHYMLGVQWHPEYIFHKASGRKIFKLLIGTL